MHYATIEEVNLESTVSVIFQHSISKDLIIYQERNGL